MIIFLKAILLGIVEGITEFLPISSTGHLIIVNRFIHFTGDFANMFDIVIQCGAILSVVIYFRPKLFPFGRDKDESGKKNIMNLWWKTLAGVIPAILVGGLFGNIVEDMLFNSLTVALALIAGGGFLLWVEQKERPCHITKISDISYKIAVMIGFIQCLAMIPGISRSAATIIGAMLLGASREVSAEFSFFLAIPTMTAASVYSLLKAGLSLTALDWQVLTVGFLVSFLVAWAVIAFFMNYIRKHDFKVFGYYRIILGIIILAQVYHNFA